MNIPETLRLTELNRILIYNRIARKGKEKRFGSSNKKISKIWSMY